MYGKIAGACIVAGLMLGTSGTAEAQRYFARQKLEKQAQSASSPSVPTTTCVGKGNLTYYASPNNGVPIIGSFKTKQEAIARCHKESLDVYDQLGAKAGDYDVACDILPDGTSFALGVTGDKKGQLTFYNPLPAIYEGFEGYFCTYSK